MCFIVGWNDNNSFNGKEVITMANKKESKKSKLNPIAKEEKGNLTDAELKEIAKGFESNADIEVIDNNNVNTDTLFAEILNQLVSKKDISMKTEYEEDDTIYAATVLDYVGRVANVPLINKFIESYEMRKVSKNRKGRIEILLGLEKRQEDIESRQRNDMLNMMPRK